MGVVIMKLYIYALVSILLLSGVTATDYCGTTCLESGTPLYSMHTLYGGDNAIMDGSDNVEASSAYDWKIGEPVDFSLEYDPASDILTYTIDGNVLQTQTTGVDYFGYIILQGQTSFYGSNSMVFTDMKLDGTPINDFSVTSGIEGIKMDPSQKFFKLEGKVTMNVEGNTNKNMAGVNIYLLDSTGSGHNKIASVPSLQSEGFIDTEDTPQIPEFGVVAAAVAMIGAVAVFAIRRKN
jgi:hypothetical protein